MEISDLLSPTDVMIDVSASDKSRLLRRLSGLAASALGLDPNHVSEQIAKREKLGNGVALPHARLTGLKAPFGLLVRLRHAIDFEAIDDRPVDIVFLVLLPETADSTKQNALACVARALRHPEALQRLRHASDRETLYRAITERGVVSSPE